MTKLVDRKFGCFYPATTVSGGDYTYTFDFLEAWVGRKFDVYSTFIDLGADYPTNPTPPGTRKRHSEIATAAANGHDLLIAFGTAYTYVQCSDGNYYPVYATGADIRAGTFDARFTSIFTWLLSLGVNVTVRFMWEANLGPNISQYYPGVQSYSSAGTPAKPTSNPLKIMTSTGQSVITSASDYIQTWQYVTNLLRALPNGNRLKMFYCPGCNDGSAAQAAGNTLTNMFPGTSYVDYVGYDTYNSLDSPWYQPLQSLAGPRPSDGSGTTAYDILTALHPTADVWIGEINCMEPTDPQANNTQKSKSKVQWYKDLFSVADDLPRLTTINFFNSPGTRATWPFNSSAAAFDAFKDGFNNGPDATQHGAVAPAYAPVDWAPPANPTNLTLPFPVTHMAGDPNRTKWFNAHEYVINQMAKPDSSGWVALNATTDGTVPNLTLTRQAPGTFYIPNISVKNPGGSSNSDVISTKLGPNTHTTFALRDDGRMAWGPGDTGDPDVFQKRISSGTLQITGSGSSSGHLSVNGNVAAVGNVTAGGYAQVTGYVQANNINMPNVSSVPAGQGTGGAQLYSQSDILKVRSSNLVYALGPPQSAKFSAICAFSPESAIGTSVAFTAGRLHLVRMIIPDGRTLASVACNVATAGSGLTSGQCFVGVYDGTGALIAQTADQSTAWTTTGVKSMALTAVTSLTVSPGFFYVGFLANGTTRPAISCSLGFGNWQQPTGATVNYGWIGANQTALPTTITLSGISYDSDCKFCSLT